MILAMSRGRGLAVVFALALIAQPVAAAPDDEIEMEGDPPPTTPDPKAPPKPPEKPVDAPKPADPAAPAVGKDPKLAKKVATTAQQVATKGDQLTRAKKLDEAKVQYEVAAEAFKKAIELGDDLNLYFDLGVVEDKLGKPAIAAGHWRTVIKATAGIRPDVLKKTTTKWEEVATKIGIVTLAVKPDGTMITQGETELGTSPLSQPLILLPGTYSFGFAADGYQLKTVAITVEPGSESERGVDLEPIKIVIDTRPPIDPTPPPPKPKPPSKLPLIIGAGATVGFLGATIITGLMAKGKHDRFVDPTTGSFDRELAAFDGKNFAKVSDAMLIGTVAAAGFTATWYFLKYRRGQKKMTAEATMSRSGEPQKSKVSHLLVPWVQPRAGGITMGGRF